MVLIRNFILIRKWRVLDRFSDEYLSARKVSEYKRVI